MTTFRITWESRFCNGFLITLKSLFHHETFCSIGKFPLDLMVSGKRRPHLGLDPLSFPLFNSINANFTPSHPFPFLINYKAGPLKTTCLFSAERQRRYFKERRWPNNIGRHWLSWCGHFSKYLFCIQALNDMSVNKRRQNVYFWVIYNNDLVSSVLQVNSLFVNLLTL